MGGRVLVAYASWVGSTAEVAEVVAEVLREGGAAVDVQPARKVRDLTHYRAVVLGTAVRIGRVHGDAPKFVQKYRAALSQMPVAYFAVCLTMQQDTEENRCTAKGYLDALSRKAPQVQPVDVGLFGGLLDLERLSGLTKKVMASDQFPKGDFRDWEAIRAWAAHVRPLLLGG